MTDVPRVPSDFRTRYRVAGMDCAGCANKIENTVRRLPGVANVDVSVPAGTMTVQHADTLPVAEIARRVEALGYTATLLREGSPRRRNPFTKLSSILER